MRYKVDVADLTEDAQRGGVRRDRTEHLTLDP
jgi:hypothetical protein